MSSHQETQPTEPVGPVIIDVDDEHGALVLTSTADRAGLEVEIEPHAGGKRRHVCVLPRATASGLAHAAVLGSLVAGRYRVLGPSGEQCDEVEVVPGRASFAEWR